ncbi:hypothetical protein PP240_gp48 [Streptococcus phage P7574]|uniref:Uncharacterized protein n=1 Tax=Streptococcus phage P7574 TaxID=1971430 RepID=A0A286QPU1_9CAUD|nr:hypothetical protein PP240_gp48 [Streptococcus phage P7574]ARU13939.1 hypothetical protein P7574_48 [Streptococcus phage P7574]
MHKPSKYFIKRRIQFYSSLALLVARLEFKIKGVVNKKSPRQSLPRTADNIIIP